MSAKAGQSSSNPRGVVQKSAEDATGDKPRRLVVVDSRGAARVKSMPPKASSPSRHRPSAQTHARPTLASYRSSLVSGLKSCYACAQWGEVRQYEARELGKVFLCSHCGEKAREETFGRKEPLDYAFLGGGFEGNRRRH